MKFWLRSLIGFALLLSGLFLASSDAQALSVSNVKRRYCHFSGMNTKWGYNTKTTPWDTYWVCQADGSNSQSKVTIYWEADQIDRNFHVEYSLDGGKTYTSGGSVSMPLTQKYMWEFIALPSQTYKYRIRSTVTGDTDLAVGEFRTNIAEGSVKYIEGFGIDFGVRYDVNKVLKWETYNFSSGNGGGCQIGNLVLQSGNYSCPGTGGDLRLRGANNWFLEDKFTHIFVKTAGGMEIDDGDNDTSSANLTVYAPNPAPFEFETGVVPNPVSLRRGSSVVADVQVTNTSEPEVAPQAVQFTTTNITGLPAGVTLSAGSSCTPPLGGTCTIPLTITTDATTPLGTYPITQTRKIFDLVVLPPLPGIAISSDAFDNSLIFQNTILQGTKHPDISFTVTNPFLLESSPLNYQITSDVSWLTVSPVTGTLRAGDNVTQVPVAISFSSSGLRVQATPYKGTITIRDLNPENAAAEKKIRVELMVTNTADFSLAVVTPGALVQGNSVGAKITLTKTTGVASDIALSVSGLPAGVAGTFAPSLCAADTLAASPCVSVLTLTADAGAAVGSKTVTISAKKPLDANGPAREQKKTFTLTVNKSFGVSLALSPASLGVAPRGTGIVRVFATLSGAGAHEVKFGVEGLPSGASAGFTPPACTQTCTSTLTINSGAAVPGTSSVAIQAKGSDGKSATASLSFTIKASATASPRPTVSGKPAPSISGTPRPGITGIPFPDEKRPLSFSLVTVRTLSVIQGSATNTSLIVSYENGDAEPVRFAVSQVPTGVTASLSLTQCVPSCYAVLTIRTTEKTPLGSSHIKILASTKDTSRTSFIELIVGTDPPSAPKNLFQKNTTDGARVGVGGTVREDRVTFAGTVNGSGSQKTRLRVEVKPTKEFFNGVTGVFEDLTRLGETGSTYEITGSKLLGGYKWRAQAVDERGIASQWAEFGANTNSEPDFVTDLSTPPTNPFEANQDDGTSLAEEKPGFIRRIFGWVCRVPGVRRMCN